MDSQTAQVHVNKLAAAQRQLSAAIRMFFGREDDLAVHTVASAAYGLLSDLKKARGREEAVDVWLHSIFHLVRAYRRESLSDSVLSNESLMETIRNFAERLPIESDTDIGEITASATADFIREYWRKRNKVSNFLKHADRDVKGHLSLDEVDNASLLLFAISAYDDLAPIDDLRGEAMAYMIYISARDNSLEGLKPEHREMALAILEFEEDEKLEACARLIEILNSSPDYFGRGV
jgi:hypothetical protein